MNISEIQQRVNDEYESLITRKRPWAYDDYDDYQPALNQAIEDVKTLLDEIEYLHAAARGF